MTQSEDGKNFSCPKCGKIGTITFLKANGDKIIVKQKCSKHGIKSFKVPLLQKDSFIPHFRKGVFRCPECGKNTIVESAKMSGPWMIVQSACPTHGKNLPVQRIWSTLYVDISNYTDISKKQISIKQEAQPQLTPSDEKKFCPNCGTPLKESGEFCDACGAKIV